MSESIDDVAERLAVVSAGFHYLSSMVWKFIDMSYLDDEPETRKMLDDAGEAAL